MQELRLLFPRPYPSKKKAVSKVLNHPGGMDKSVCLAVVDVVVASAPFFFVEPLEEGSQ